MAGRRGKVLRIAAAATLVVLLVAGCGGAAPPQQVAVRGVPSALAQDWEGKAAAIAAAAAAGNDCRAQGLAVSLRAQVIDQEHKLPLRLRSPLVTGLDSLVARTTCTQTATTPTTARLHGPEPPHKHPDKPKPQHKHHGHGNQGGDQGGDG